MDFNTLSENSTYENDSKSNNITFFTIPIQNIESFQSDQLQSEYILKTLADGSLILEGSQISVTQVDEVNSFFGQQLFTDPKLSSAEEITVPKDEFTCRFCNEKFDSKILLKRHEKGHIYEKPYKCENCSASYNVLSNLHLHQMICSNDAVSLKCPMCNKLFSRFASLKAHLAIHQSDDQLLCPECEKPFDTLLQVDIHMKTHLKTRKYSWKCRFCKEEFSNQAFYKSHMAEHSKVRQILSTLKTRSNGKRTNFKRNKVGRHVCTVCSKSFIKYSLLVRHSRVHSGEKPYKCKICGGAFSQSNTLKIHMFKHTGTRPYKCSLCTAAFSQIGNLRVHIVRVHSLERNANTFPCNECECIFRKLSTLNAHINRVHNNVPIENVSSPFSVIQEIMLLNKAMSDVGTEKSTDILQQAVENSAIKDVPLTPNSWDNSENKLATTPPEIIEQKSIINNTLSQKNSVPDDIEIRPITLADRAPDGTLRRHVVYQRKVGNIRWHQCSFCPKEFKKPSDLVRHIRIHTNEKPYKCNICERSFTVKTTLTSHMRTHANHKTRKVNAQKSSQINQKSNQTSQKSNLAVEREIINQCPYCNKKIPNLKLLESHIKKHELKTNMNSSKGLLSNIQMHEPFYVTDKGLIESYVSPKNRVSLENRPHVCTQCNAAFRKISHLKQHLRIHSDERPFSCNVCNRRFRSLGVLRNHKRAHEGLRPFTCKECNHVFSTSGSLQRHLTSHSSRRPFLCPYCHKSFKTFSNCRKHITIHKLEVAMNLQKGTKLENENNTHEEISFVPDKNIQIINEVEADQTVNIVNPENTVLHTLITDQTGNVTLAELDTTDIPMDILLNVQENLDQIVTKGVESETNVESEHLQVDNVENTNTMNIVFTVSKGNENMLLEVAKPNASDSCIESSTSTAEPITNTSDLFINKISENLESVALSATHLEMLSTSSNPNDEIHDELNAEEVKLKKNQCSFCAKIFRKPSDLKRHIRTHTGERPFSCHLCDKKFSLNSTLKSHLKIHGLITKDFVCTVCKSAFGTKGSLKVHMRLHTGVRPFPCDYCGLRFRTSGHKLAHHQAHLKEIERQKVDADSKSSKNFGTKNKIRKLHDQFLLENQTITNSDNNVDKIINQNKSEENSHIETVYLVSKPDENVSQLPENPLNITLNSTNILDPEILKSFNSQGCFEVDLGSIMVSSVAPEAIVSNECENLIPTTDNSFLSVEQEVQEKKMFLCGFCLKFFGKSSQLQRHLRIHTGERPFVCSICNKAFNQKNVLDRHLKTHLDCRPYQCPYCEYKFTQKGNLKTHIQRTHESGKISLNQTLPAS